MENSREIPQEKQQQQQQLGIKLSYPTIPLLGIYPEETITERDTCNPMFIAALFTIAKTWKQPRRPMTHQWYIYEMEYYSPIKRNSFELVLIRWMKLDSIIPSEVSQKEKNKYHILTQMYGIQKASTDEPICRAAMETQIQRTDLQIRWGKERVAQMREQH